MGQKMSDRAPGAEGHSGQIDGNDPLEVSARKLVTWRLRQLDASIIDQNIEASFRKQTRENLVHRRRIGNVGIFRPMAGLDDTAGRAERVKTFKRLARGFGIAEMGDDDRCAFGGETFRDRAADAARSAGDEGLAAGEASCGVHGIRAQGWRCRNSG